MMNIFSKLSKHAFQHIQPRSLSFLKAQTFARKVVIKTKSTELLSKEEEKQPIAPVEKGQETMSAPGIPNEGDFEYEHANVKGYIEYLYKYGKLTVMSSKTPNESEWMPYYKFIIQKIKQLTPEDIKLLLKAIAHIGCPDKHTNDILNRCLKEGTTESAMLVVYTIVKLNIRSTTNEILTKAVDIILKSNIEDEPITSVIPFVWSISQIKLDNKALNAKIDQFVLKQIENFDEYEVAMSLRFYSKLNYLNYDVLEVLLKKSIELCENLSIRYILIITKCLAELNIKNLNLLTGLTERLNKLIKDFQKNPDDPMLHIDADSFAQILSNLVKLKFVEFDDFRNYEKSFFEYAEKDGIKNKETILTIIMAHSNFMRLVDEEMNKNNPSLKIKRGYKKINEEFYELFFPHLIKFKDQINFLTANNIIYTFKDSHILKRKVIRMFAEFHTEMVNKHLNPEEITKLDQNKVKDFIKNSMKILSEYSQMTKEAKEILIKNNINMENYVKL